MKIMFFNVWQAGMGEIFWEYLEKEAKDIDVFCFMEAGEKFRNDFFKRIKGYNLFAVEKAVANEDGSFQSTFVKNNLEVVETGTMLMDDEYTGMGLYTKIKVDNKIIDLVNVHGVALPGEKLDNPKRLKQSEGIIKFMEDKGDYRIIGGDFNLDKNTESIKMFEKAGYRNLIEEYQIETTRNRLSWEKFNRVQYWADFCFVDKKIKVKSFEVPKNEVSDHLSLILEIELLD